jgi:hypothetical protein
MELKGSSKSWLAACDRDGRPNMRAFGRRLVLTRASVIEPPGGEHGGDVIARPELEPVENRRQRLAERRDRVFDRNRRRRPDGSGDQPIALHLLQRLRQHLLRHAFNVAP